MTPLKVCEGCGKLQCWRGLDGNEKPVWWCPDWWMCSKVKRGPMIEQKCAGCDEVAFNREDAYALAFCRLKKCKF